MNNIFRFLLLGFNGLSTALNCCGSLFLLGIRIYLARIFLWSGYLKYSNWTSTIYTFEHDYKVAYLSPEVAAYLGTTSEILFPFLMLIGLGGRIPALCLFIFNIISVISFPLLMTPQFDCARKDHILWAVLILTIVFFSHGKLSLDYLINRKVNPNYKY